LLDINGIGVHLFTGVIKVQRNALKLNRVREASCLPVISHSCRRETLITIACQNRGVAVVRPIPKNPPNIGSYGSIIVIDGVLFVDKRYLVRPMAGFFEIYGLAGPDRLHEHRESIHLSNLVFFDSSLSLEYIGVGMKSILRGNLQVQFGGEGALTLPYEYSDYNNDLELGQSRLLEVDNRVVLPAKSHIRFSVTYADVPYSWVVPFLGVKCDVVPGCLNKTSISVQREGVYYGQCSEICGTNHAFIPIIVEDVPRKDYGSRVSNQLIPQTPDKEPILVASPLESPLSWGGPVRRTEMDLNKPPLLDDNNCRGELENRLITLLLTSLLTGEGLAPIVGYSLESLVEKRNQIRAKPSRIKARNHYSNCKRPTYGLSTVCLFLPSLTKWMLYERLGRRDFAKDGMSVREEGLFPFSFHCLTRFALQGSEGVRAGRKGWRSSYGHKGVRYSKLLLRLLLVIGLEATGDAFLLVEILHFKYNTSWNGVSLATVVYKWQESHHRRSRSRADLDVERTSQAEAEKKAYNSVGFKGYNTVKNRNWRISPIRQINGTGHWTHRQESQFDRTNQTSEIFWKRKCCANFCT
ncbi:hypothetical protein H5410_028065, partial [Solanum commersonii]